MTGWNTKWRHSRSPSQFLRYWLIFLSLDQQDELREPFFREQLRPKPYLHSSYKTYGSNTAHCLRERSQCLLLATHGTTDCWEIPFFRNEIKYSFRGWLLIYVHSNTTGSFQLVMRVLYLDNHLKGPSRSASRARQLHEYYFLHATWLFDASYSSLFV
jgi:hypothetical protein